MKMKPLDILIFGSMGAALLTAFVFMASTPEGEADWEAYVRDHHCQPQSALDGSNRSGWLCDDGKVHYRWRQQR